MQWYVKLWIAWNDIYGMWLSLIRIRIHCLHSPMKFKLACIPRTSYIYTLHTAQKNNMRCWKWFFMRNNDQRRQNIFFTLVLSVFFFKLFISHKSIKCVQLFYWISLPFLLHFSFSRINKIYLEWFFPYSVCFSHEFLFCFPLFPLHGRSFIRTALIDGRCK